MTQEITAEIFETWYPKNPEKILEWFLQTGSEYMHIKVKHSDYELVATIDRNYAIGLLNELKEMRKT